MRRTIYEVLLANGVEMSNHESDLHAKDTPEVRELLKSRNVNWVPLSPGWLEVPFAWDPYWRRRAPDPFKAGKWALRARGKGGHYVVEAVTYDFEDDDLTIGVTSATALYDSEAEAEAALANQPERASLMVEQVEPKA